jgi:hypothetical protein
VWKPLAIALPVKLAISLVLSSAIWQLPRQLAHSLLGWPLTVFSIVVAVALAVWLKPAYAGSVATRWSVAILLASVIFFAIPFIEINHPEDGLSNSFASHGSFCFKTRSDPHMYYNQAKYHRGHFFFGFGVETYTRADGHYEKRILLHIWPVILVSAIFPASWLRQLYRSRLAARRAAGNQCVNCGYNLQASPDRCPECGTRVSAR